MTPEGKVKSLINKYLSTLRDPLNGVEIYIEMPVPTGFGKSGLDYTMCLCHFVAIEAKAPDEWLTRHASGNEPSTFSLQVARCS